MNLSPTVCYRLITVSYGRPTYLRFQSSYTATALSTFAAIFDGNSALCFAMSFGKFAKTVDRLNTRGIQRIKSVCITHTFTPPFLGSPRN